jgi:hypothetical protein
LPTISSLTASAVTLSVDMTIVFKDTVGYPVINVDINGR